MASVYVDIPGIGNVEAKNAATESTLRELVDAMKNMSGGKGMSSAEAAKNLKIEKQNVDATKDQTKETKKSTEVFKKFGEKSAEINKTLGVMGRGFNDLVESVSETMNEFANLGDSITNAARSFGNLPIVGDALSSVFGVVAGAAERQLKSYQELASSGATFGGSLVEMTRAASGAGLTVEQFSKVISSNSQAMMILGGTTEAGAKRFAQLGKEMKNSAVGEQLLRMGYSTEQINEGMASYINIIGRGGKVQSMTTQELAQESGQYLKELDALAKITGVSRKEKEKEQEALMKDAQVRAAMAGMDAESQRQMIAYITSFPKEQQTAIKDMIATGNITSEEAIKLNSMLPGAARQAMEFGRILQQGGKISTDSMSMAKDAAIQEARDNEIRFKEQGMYNKEMGEAYLGLSELARQGVGDLNKAFSEQENTINNANKQAAITNFMKTIAELGNTFTSQLVESGVLESMSSAFSTLGTLATTFLIPAFGLLANGINFVVPMISEYLGGAIQFLQTSFSVMQPVIQTLTSTIQEYAIPILTALGAVIGTAIIPALMAKAAALWASIAPVLAAAAPFVAIGVIVGLAVKKFKDMGGSVDVFVDMLKVLKMNFQSFFLKLKEGFFGFLNKLPGMRGDFADDLKVIKDQQKALAEEKLAVETKIITTMEANREKMSKDSIKRVEEAQKKSIEKQSEQSKEQSKKSWDYSSPEAMARSLAARAPGAPRTTIPGGGLGGLSERYEAGSLGSSAVGFDTTGGTSYGKYQIATRTGTMNKFMDYLKTNNPEAYERLKVAGPADAGKEGAFAQEWKKLAGEGKLAGSEHDFIKKTHFDVGMGGLKNDALKGMIEKSKALQEVMWSTSVQHGGGGASGIFGKVYKEGMSEQDLIKAIYAERGTRFGSSTSQVRSSVQNRFADEQQRALAMIGQPGSSSMPNFAQSSKSTGEVATSGKSPAAVAAGPVVKEASLNDVVASLNQLNMQMGQVLMYNKQVAETSNKQLSVQKSMSGDLFAA